MALQQATTTQLASLNHAASRRLYSLQMCVCYSRAFTFSHGATLAMGTCLGSTQPDTAGRAVGCSDLYNMSEAINAQTAADNTARSPIKASSSSSSGNLAEEAARIQAQKAAEQPSSSSLQQSGSSNNAAGYNSSYYAGLLTADLQEDNKASGADMLKRSLQLAGGAAGILVLLTIAFLRANNLI